jgi:hypothetical protein
VPIVSTPSPRGAGVDDGGLDGGGLDDGGLEDGGLDDGGLDDGGLEDGVVDSVVEATVTSVGAALLPPSLPHDDAITIVSTAANDTASSGRRRRVARRPAIDETLRRAASCARAPAVA